MKTPTLSTHELCNLVKPNFSDLQPLCYNRYQREKSDWWLLPKKVKKPAYKYPKLCFMPDERDENVVLSGLYVEKGLGKGYDKKIVMDQSWGWHRIVAELKYDTLPKILERITASTGMKPIIMLSGQFRLPSSDSNTPRLKAETIYFAADGRSIHEADYHPSPDKNPLCGLRSAGSLSELADRLHALPQSDFIWIDMAIVVPLAFDAAANASETAESLSKQVLAHFESWVAG